MRAPRLFLLDGLALAYRSHFAFIRRPLLNSRGEHTSALFAFANTVTNNNPDPMVNPFGPGSKVTHSQWTISFGASWALERKR